MNITTKERVWMFVGVITVIAVVVANVGNFVLLTPAVFHDTIIPGTSIAILIALPISYFVGTKLKALHDAGAALSQLVNRDHLTKTSTREFFFNRMDAMGAAGSVVGVTLMIDIDHFKRVNDTYGHFVGDAVLKHVSAVLIGAVRPDDLVSRFGGEEFVIFLNDVSEDTGREIGERLRRTIEGTHIVVEGMDIVVTVSVGAARKLRATRIDDALKAADRALYLAKARGRNRLEFEATADAA